MHALILAAGRGERMRPLTDRRPKVLLEVGGKPLIAWHLENLRRAGCERVAINHAWLGEQIEQVVGDGSRFGLQILYSAEQTALETAGGIATALPLIGQQPFMVVNGDIFVDLEFADLLPRLLALAPGSTLAHLVLVDNPAHHPGGDFVLNGDRVEADGAQRLTFSGIGLYHPVLFSAVAPNERAPLAPLLRQAMSRHAVSGQRYAGAWFDIGTPERLQQINELVRERNKGA
jgi:MurNAc alpha-1-phosphate uridylyltransferase